MLQNHFRKNRIADTALLPVAYSDQVEPSSMFNSKSLALSLSTLKSTQANFCKEIQDSLSGKKTSLKFILHSLSSNPLVSIDETFQVMVIGGSVFKESLVKNKGASIILSDKKQDKLPIFKTKNDFFIFIETHLRPSIKTVALNFAYPLKPVSENGKLDGILISGVKEHTFTGLVGKQIGRELETHFWKKYQRKISFALANDTVCLLLSGLGKATQDNLACGIVGTGVNLAFFLNDNKLVNLESAGFDKFPISLEAKEIDIASTHPGQSLFEKETAGAYLYQHFNSIIKKHGLPYSPLATTWELKKLAMQNSSLQSAIAKVLIKKSAALIAAQIAGIVLFKTHDMTFVMDGSFFWGEDIYKQFVEDYLRVLIPDRKVTFISIPNSTFLGAAKLVC